MHKLAYLTLFASCVFGAGTRIDTVNSSTDTTVFLKPIKSPAFKGPLSGTADSAKRAYHADTGRAAKISDSTKKTPDTLRVKGVFSDTSSITLSKFTKVWIDTVKKDMRVKGRTHANRLLKDSIYHVYGGFQDSAITITLSGANWAMIKNTAGTLWHGLEGEGLTISSDTMVITNTADYFGEIALTFTGQSGKDYYFRIYNVTQAVQMGYKVGVSATGSNLQQVSVPLYLECNAGDRLRAEVMTSNNGNNPVMRDAVFYNIYLHE
jgi:hypothetical protein